MTAKPVIDRKIERKPLGEKVYVRFSGFRDMDMNINAEFDDKKKAYYLSELVQVTESGRKLIEKKRIR